MSQYKITGLNGMTRMNGREGKVDCGMELANGKEMGRKGKGIESKNPYYEPLRMIMVFITSIYSP